MLHIEDCGNIQGANLLCDPARAGAGLLPFRAVRGERQPRSRSVATHRLPQCPNGDLVPQRNL